MRRYGNKIKIGFQFIFSGSIFKTGKYWLASFFGRFEKTIFSDVCFDQIWMALQLFILCYLVRNENAGNAFNRCSMYTVHAQKQLFTFLSETKFKFKYF